MVLAVIFGRCRRWIFDEDWAVRDHGVIEAE
jgi:hypothetical protein